MFNGHLETILPVYLQNEIKLQYQRERLTLSDDDFVDLDWIYNNSENLVILTHGVIGNSERYYILRGAHFFKEKGWDILAWNCRSRSGEMNKKIRMYHHGEIEDLTEVVQHAHDTKRYKNIYLIGYSMGGSMVTKYLHVKKDVVPSTVRKGISICAPFDLELCSLNLDRPLNVVYRHYFVKALREVFAAKAAQFPDVFDMDLFDKARTWREIDTHFSAPINGFASADEFYYHASSQNFLKDIQIPTLIIAAQNDPIIPFQCVPESVCSDHPYLYLEAPDRGGHVGFTRKGRKEMYAWIDYRAGDFFGV